ncbi:hypothetical protein HMN09_00436300 [Mycena chlorophos]|uniref:Nucleoporin Nup159/Nup146 N-terminal domain-containing protein n=1 Tax=Mycena chlorophos TaxID=658473 RepID=A0A8H6WLQ5_MYCCL|nr:hypothetical protein HMN09_00436300 [Mycena chlorophos]
MAAPLRRPEHSQITLDPTPAQPQSDGFNYPAFRLLNKQSRVCLSPESLVPSNFRRVFATASANGGWFAASTSAGLVVSPSKRLREAFKNGEETFAAQCTLACNPVAITFACNDTRLLAGTADGQILVYEMGSIFSGAASANPIKIHSASASPPLQILPNPSSENELAQLVAIVRADGTVEMLDMEMQLKGAWQATDSESTPVAASWSPKGKQLGIGLRSGDILTFGLTNNATPLKHVPPTAKGQLVSLDWLGPTFTFRTSYASDDSAHHIVTLNTQSNTATFVQLIHPFPLSDRSPNAHVLVLPRWDYDSSGPDKILVVVGDSSSTDLEVVACAGTTWFQQSQENPLSIPLDKNDQDTFLLALAVDLTDEMPVMYAYLNDGTVQAWYITHPDSKPYPGLVAAAGEAQPATPAAVASPTPAAFGQSTFGQSSQSAFGQPPQSAFGQPSQSAFPNPSPSAAPAFGQSSFGQTTQSAFGTSSFGSSTSTAFGTSGFNAFASSSPSAFGAPQTPTAPPMSATPSVSMGEDSGPSFGGLSLGGSSSDNKSKPAAGGMFGSFGSSPSPLPLPPNHPANQPTTPSPANFSDPALVKPAAGFGAFGGSSGGAFSNPKPASTTAFGGGAAFGGGFGGAQKESSSASPSPATSAFGKPAFGQPAFGQPAFGQSGFAQKSAFGQTSLPSGGAFSSFASSGPSSFGTSTTSSSSGGGAFSAFASQTPSAFGKPAAAPAFGSTAFGSTPTPATNTGFGQTPTSTSSPAPSAAGGNNPSTSPASAFGNSSPSPASPASAFGNSGTSSVFGNSDSPKFTTGGSAPAVGAFSNLKSASSAFKPAAGFGAFGNNTPTSSPFFNNNNSAQSSPPVSAFSSSPIQSSPSTPIAGKPAFGSTSALGTPKSAFAPISTPSSSVSNAFNAFTSSSTTFTAAAAPSKSFADLLKDGDEKVKEASDTPSPSPAVASVKRAPVFTPPPKQPEAVSPAPAETKKDAVVSDKSSASSLSQASSFVEVSAEEVQESNDAKDDGDDAEEPPADEDDFLSESFGSESEGDEEYSRSPSPSAVPLPPSRSPSSTPRGERASSQAPESPTQPESDGDESDSSEVSKLSTIQEESETPPGSPEKKPAPSSAPLPAPIPLAPSPFGIGLGRPSTRPTKSSPLAAAPLSGDESNKLPPKPRPASPKLPFGTLPTQTKVEDLTPKPSRPKTPPLFALSFGSATPKTVEPAQMSLGNITLPPFPNLGKASPTTPSPVPLVPTTSGGGVFGAGPKLPSPSPAPNTTGFKGFFSSPPVTAPAPALAPAKMPAQPTPAPTPELTMEEGMQKECAMLFASITRELEDFRLLAQTANRKRMELGKSAGGSRRPSDLGDRSKWSLGDMTQFGQTMLAYERELDDLKETRSHWEIQLREVQSNLLKAGTRREEVGRFLKAQNDKEFAKMLKARTLGPEHLETQTQLRRGVRTIQDRIQKLESNLQESKKRLSRANSGNPGLRAPTLDTLNRTFRNMDIALDNQTGDVEKLVARVAKLSMTPSRANGHGRDARLPDRQRPVNVTPDVAVTTAAALNAERSAHKLKRALLAARKQPLLNTQAASAPPAPVAFKTPVKAFALDAASLPATMPGFDLPEDHFNPASAPLPSTRRGGGSRTRVSGSVPLKRSPGPAPATASPPAFDWGPLPTFGKPKSEDSLSSSWVSEGFKGFGTSSK